jgi:protocatechuate 3,4-dioxygenase, beta subunit
MTRSTRSTAFVGRRRLFGAGVAPLALVLPTAAPAADAAPARLAPTPRQTRGPYYPPDPPRDAGDDLVIERDGRRAAGELLRLDGRVLDVAGRPLAGTRIELWQCNAAGRYHHPRDNAPAPIDPLFRAYGVSVADAEGRWRFRTIRPVPYPGRTPHLHLILTAPDGRSLTTQVYIRGEPGNARDGLLAGLSPAERERLMADVVRAADGNGWRTAFEAVLAA